MKGKRVVGVLEKSGWELGIGTGHLQRGVIMNFYFYLFYDCFLNDFRFTFLFFFFFSFI